MKAIVLSAKEEVALVQMYITQRKGVIEVGNYFGISRTVVKRILKSKGYSLRNMVESHLGQVAWNKGKSWPPEMRKRLSKKALALKRFGAKNPNWRGGKDPYWDNRRNLKVYKDWREKCLTRDSNRCRECFSSEKLEVNHIVPLRSVKTMRQLADVNNGITLCKSCHFKTYSSEEKHIDRLRKLLKSREFRGTPERTILTQAKG